LKEIYLNKYSSSDLWNIRITEIGLDSDEKYRNQAEWIWNDIDYNVSENSPDQGKNQLNLLLKARQDARRIESKYLKAKVTVNGFKLSVDMPVTEEQMSKGLSIKDKLKENEAMLFVFEEPSRQPFWMKDMKFPIDIAWLDSNGKTVHIEENLAPCMSIINCPLYAPNTSSQYALETTAGFTRRHGLNLGTKILIELIR